MTTDSLPARRRDDLPSVARLLTLSDNVVAIALTLLVLQVKVPPPVQVANPASAADLAAQLAKEADQLISYVIAFYVVAQFWLAHHRVFRHVAGHHEGLAWWNFAFLFTITAMPFTSSLLGEYGNNPLAVDIFAVNLLLATLATQATLLYGQRRDVLIAPPGAAEAGARWIRLTVIVFAVALSIGLAWVNTSAAKYCWLLIPLAPWAADRWSARTASRAGAAGAPGH
jgi:TMEM175 potassium channel family protein